jgi:hypothetical protein
MTAATTRRATEVTPDEGHGLVERAAYTDG